MRLRRVHAAVVIFSGGILWSVGCGQLYGTNQFKVVVERLDVPNSPSPLPRAAEITLLRTQEKLTRAHQFLVGLPGAIADERIRAVNAAKARRLSGAQAEPLSASAQSQLRAAIAEQMDDELKPLVAMGWSLVNEGNQLIENAKRLYDPNFQITLAAPGGSSSLQATMVHSHRIDVFSYVTNVSNFIRSANSKLEPLLRKHKEKIGDILKQNLEQQDGSKSTIDESLASTIISDLPDIVVLFGGELRADATELESQRSAFGGFLVTGIFVLDPADPAYARVLDPRTRARTFASATSTTAGDSNIVIVFDDPVRPRTFQLQNDPTQLIRNVVSVIDMAVQAVAKYATVPG